MVDLAHAHRESHAVQREGWCASHAVACAAGHRGAKPLRYFAQQNFALHQTASSMALRPLLLHTRSSMARKAITINTCHTKQFATRNNLLMTVDGTDRPRRPLGLLIGPKHVTRTCPNARLVASAFNRHDQSQTHVAEGSCCHGASSATCWLLLVYRCLLVSSSAV